MGIFGILFFTLLATPLFFQILFGNGVFAISRKMKFWHISLISIALLFVTFFITLKMLDYRTTTNQIQCGMPFVGLMVMEIMITVAVLLTILIQIFRNRKK